MRLITARYDGRCDECGGQIEEGDRIGWDPETREKLCESCAWVIDEGEGDG